MRVTRILIGLTMFSASAAASAQSFNEEWQRYRASRLECGERYRHQVERDCDQQCRAAAENRQTQCLAAAERRYESALGQVLRSPR